MTEALYALNAPELDRSRKSNIETLLRSTFNGDEVSAYLPLNAQVRREVMGWLFYVLTNNRVIKFDIDTQEIKSASFPLDTITAFERTIEGNREGIKISFQNGSFGLNYTTPNDKISNFFQKVDQARAQKGASGRG